MKSEENYLESTIASVIPFNGAKCNRCHPLSEDYSTSTNKWYNVEAKSYVETSYAKSSSVMRPKTGEG